MFPAKLCVCLRNLRIHSDKALIFVLCKSCKFVKDSDFLFYKTMWTPCFCFIKFMIKFSFKSLWGMFITCPLAKRICRGNHLCFKTKHMYLYNLCSRSRWKCWGEATTDYTDEDWLCWAKPAKTEENEGNQQASHKESRLFNLFGWNHCWQQGKYLLFLIQFKSLTKMANN